MTDTLTPINRSSLTLRDMVQDRMRSAIIEGHFAPGERLVERALSDQLGVSRTVIRETLRFLEAEGLVEVEPHRGPSVARLDWPKARQIYAIRAMLETDAAATCAERITPAIAKPIVDGFHALSAARADGVDSALIQATSRFYEAIFLGAGQDVAWEVVSRLNARISRLRLMTLADEGLRARSGQEHMQAICHAVISGQAEAARAAVSAHLEDAARVAERVLAAEG